MADSESPTSPVLPARPITMIPVGLKEAALDSPSFRSGFTHFTEQLELVDRWLSGYYRCISRLNQETAPFEAAIESFLSQSSPPTHVSEAVLDHDYCLLAAKRYADCAKEFWTAALAGLKRMDVHVVNPIRVFINTELSAFKDIKRHVEATQKQMDGLQSRYAAQAKSKEPSSLREDAFQLHEARKAYLKAAMDFSVAAPYLRTSLDKLLVRIVSDQWRDLRDPRLNTQESMTKWGADIDRVRGWSREMENGELAFRRELDNARRQIEEDVELALRPSRELDDYALGAKQRGPSVSVAQLREDTKISRPEKQGTSLSLVGCLSNAAIKKGVQVDRNNEGCVRGKRYALITMLGDTGWLMLRTVTGKPSRTLWVRRWFYIKNGTFGWLVQGSRTNAVEESDRIGVLLCSIRRSDSDDRRHVFEVKTKDRTLVVQAESSVQLSEWIATFEVAKQRALEQPASIEGQGGSKSQDLAFSISPPSAPEFAAVTAEPGAGQSSDDQTMSIGPDRSSTLPVPGADLGPRSSFDVGSSRRPSALEGAIENPRDSASRIMSRLDLHKKSTSGGIGGAGGANSGGGGIASLIAASHGSMPVGPGALPVPPTPDTPSRRIPTPLTALRELPSSTLAPSTLANPPAPTNLSSTAVVVSGDRVVGLSSPDSSGGVPSGLLANVWGSSNWGFLNRLERGEIDGEKEVSSSTSRIGKTSEVLDQDPGKPQDAPTNLSTAANSSAHRKTMSLDAEPATSVSTPRTIASEYPTYYPAQLKMQDAQFRLLFPDAPCTETVVLVFKATWNPNEQQEFPGRIYVTDSEIYFYSNHCGMTMTTSICLKAIAEVTGANGRDWDVIFLHLHEDTSTSGFTRIMIKTFLEPLNLLQQRLSYLVSNAANKSPVAIEEVMRRLMAMDTVGSSDSPTEKGWEKVPIDTPVDGSLEARAIASPKRHQDLRAHVLVDQGIYGTASKGEAVKPSKSFKLPRQPVQFVPSGMDQLVVEKEFDVSPKALFHVLFGDRSAVWQLLYHERQAQRIRQGPWIKTPQSHLRRDFEYEIQYMNLFGGLRTAQVLDSQHIDTATEHLLYCVTDRKTPWHLPRRGEFTLLSKIVITHVAKARCKVAIFAKVDWSSETLSFARAMISKAALRDMEIDALDLVDVLTDQVRRLVGTHGRTKKAIQIFGQIGQQTQISEFAGSESTLDARLRRSRKPLSLASLLLRHAMSLMETVATTLLQLTGDCIRLTWKTLSANAIILVLLLISVGLNFLFSARGTAEWWRERQTASLMTQLGIGPVQSLDRVIYVHDLAQATTLQAPSSAEQVYSECRGTFESLINPLDNQTENSGTALLPNTRTAATLRLQRSRRHLGSRRHDLLVAMRIVNSVEQELLQAEWERWLRDENSHCQQLGKVIQQQGGEAREQLLSGSVEQGQLIQQWHKDYCGSCRRELERVTSS